MDVSKLTSKVIGDKKRWRQFKARKEQIPEPYRSVLDAVQRYTYYRGPATGDASMSLLEDLADVVEQAAASRTPIADLVGDDPVEFAEGFIRNYADADWVAKERRRLIDAVEAAAGAGGAREPEPGGAAADEAEGEGPAR